MNKFILDKVVRDFASEARRREKSHFRGIKMCGLLVGLSVPVGVAANGVVPGLATFILAGLLAWPTHKIIRRLSRNRTRHMYAGLAEKFREKFPEESGHYKPALHCLIGLRPKTDVVTNMIEHLPGADAVVAETADGTVRFTDDSAKATAQTAKAPALSLDGTSVGANSLQDLMKSFGMPPMAGIPTQDELMEFVNAHPDAKATITESSTGNGGYVKTVKIVSSSTTMNMKGSAPAPPQAPAKAEDTPSPQAFIKSCKLMAPPSAPTACKI